MSMCWDFFSILTLFSSHKSQRSNNSKNSMLFNSGPQKGQKYSFNISIRSSIYHTLYTFYFFADDSPKKDLPSELVLPSWTSLTNQLESENRSQNSQSKKSQSSTGQQTIGVTGSFPICVIVAKGERYEPQEKYSSYLKLVIKGIPYTICCIEPYHYCLGLTGINTFR